MRRRCFCRLAENEIYFCDMIEFANNNSAIIIDVRSPQEYAEWHVEGAINIPLWNVKSVVNRYVKSYTTFIVLYCSSGIRSRKAQRILWDLGYNNVYNVNDGIYGE